MSGHSREINSVTILPDEVPNLNLVLVGLLVLLDVDVDGETTMNRQCLDTRL